MNKYSVDFTTIPEEYITKITEEVKRLKCTPIMISRTTNHPDDDKLFVVLAQYDDSPAWGKAYCVWDANVFGEKASLFYGHYGLSFRSALQVVLDKTRDLNKEEL